MPAKAKAAELFHRRRVRGAGTHPHYRFDPAYAAVQARLELPALLAARDRRQAAAHLLVALRVVNAAYAPGTTMAVDLSASGLGVDFAAPAMDLGVTAVDAVADAEADLAAAATRPLDDVAGFAAKMATLQVAEPGALQQVAVTVGAPSDAGVTLAWPDGQATLAVTAQTGFFDAGILAAWSAALGRALAALIDMPDGVLADIALAAGEPDRASRCSALPQDDYLDARFRAQAAAAADRVALAADGLAWRYAELHGLADGYAGALRAAGLGSGDVVALALHKSPRMVALMLGVLRSGAAFLPVDPDLPPSRRDFMIRDSRSALVVTDGTPAGDAAPSVALADLAPAPFPGAQRDPADVAAVLYTSGSTGQPKGIALSHRALARKIASAIEQFGWDEHLSCPLLGYVGSDACAYQVFVTLGAGGRLSVLPTEEQLDAHRFWAHLRRHRSTMINCVPGFLQAMLSGLTEPPPALHDVVLGGDAVAPELAKEIRARLAPRRLINLYGPTEITVEAVNWTAGPYDDLREIPIGHAAPGYRVTLTDERDRVVPDGVVGEVVIGGDWLAQGYLGRPALTAAAFAPDPDGGGGRVYRTGDLGRRRGDGAILFLGRRDHQVKIRGHRVETGEIEVRLKRQAGVRDAIVTAEGEVGGERRLTAYCLGPDPKAADDLRLVLAAELPMAMVPAALHVLPAWPMTPNGKVDRQRLAEAAAAGIASAPLRADPLVRRILAVWQHILARPAVGVDEDFFAAGGDSLRAARLVNALRQDERLDLGFRDLMAASSVARLAERVRARPALAPPAIPRVADAPDYPLVRAQQRVWMHIQIAPLALAAYNMPEAYRIEGDVDLNRLAAAAGALVARHEALRTGFIERDGMARQVVAEPGPVACRLLPAPTDPTAAVAAHLADEARTPFDLAQPPLLRLALLPLGPGRQVLILTSHHLVCDGRSMQVIWRDLIAAFEADGPVPGATLVVRPRDIVAWQAAWLAGSEAVAARRFWAGEIAGATGDIDVPRPDFPRPAVPDYAARAVYREFDPETATALRALCGAHGVTPYTVLATLTAVLLARHAGQDEAAFLTDVIGRDHAAMEEMVGYFGNLVYLRLAVPAGAALQDLLPAARRRMTEALAHRAYPFDLVVKENRVPQRPGRMPLANVLVEMQVDDPFAAAAPRGTGLTLTRIAPPDVADVFDMTFSFQVGETLSLRLSYATSLYAQATAEAIAAQFAHLLRRALDAPAAPLTAAALVGEGERMRLLSTWNPEADYAAPEDTLPRRFAAAAARWPARPALRQGEEVLTYAELDARVEAVANGLAARLGPAPRIVPLALRRRIPAIVAMLAVQRAGHAYCPLDPASPGSRLAELCDCLEPPLVIADDLPPASAAALDRWPLVSLVALGEPGGAPRAVAPDDPAYVIHTSGSTGLPKGVLVSHRAILTTVQWKARAHGIGGGSRLLSVSPLHFDTSVGDVHTALCNGAELVLPERGVDSDLDDMCETIATRGITHMVILPNLYAGLLEAGPARLRGLRRVVLGGEAVPPRLLTRHFARLPDVDLVNEYGPAETAISTTVHVFAGPDDPVRIGRPVDGRQVDVLGPDGELVPVGAAGEICVAGPCLALGYAGQPAETAARFPPHPLRPGLRMYRTGDLGRWHADGTLAHLGRTDHQVKIRGVRVELDEVENVLAEAAGTREVAALAPVQADGERRLVAYFTQGRSDLTEAGLKGLMAARLPDHMLPARVLRLDALPRTGTGKIDRNALADRLLPAAPVTARPARGVEVTILSRWSEVLERAVADPEANFFDVGGHSLAALRIVALLQRDLGVAITISDLFNARTASGLALLLAGRTGDGRIDPAGRPRRDPEAARPLTAMQQRIWMAAPPDDPGACRLVHGAVLARPVPAAELIARFAVLVASAPALRATIATRSGRLYLVPGAVSDGQVTVRMLAALEQPEQVVADQPPGPVDPGAGRPVHLSLFADAGGGGVRGLVLTAHHVVCDGAGIAAILRALLIPDAPPPTPLESPASAGREEATAYWRDLLRNAPRTAAVPFDFAVRPGEPRRGAKLTHLLTQRESDRLDLAARDAGASRHAVLLAAAARMFGGETGVSEVLLGFPMALPPAFPGEINCHVDAGVVRLRLAPTQPFAALVAAAQAGTLAALDHRAVSSLDAVPGSSVDFGVTWEDLGLATIDAARMVDMRHKREALDADLWVYGHREAEGLAVSLVYDRARYRAATARRLLDRLLETVAGSPVLPTTDAQPEPSFRF